MLSSFSGCSLALNKTESTSLNSTITLLLTDRADIRIFTESQQCGRNNLQLDSYKKIKDENRLEAPVEEGITETAPISLYM